MPTVSGFEHHWSHNSMGRSWRVKKPFLVKIQRGVPPTPNPPPKLERARSEQSPESRPPTFPEVVRVLHECPDAVVDICFVHGLNGNRGSTWTASG
ncbi:hypothetical protein B0H67DRAFT_574366 [Lasiosphaeris hirsuta]|uniref:Uncharacterized protein n=1 Tax=Lasiosphaeris hirsuta TaxID=260670 RepID=A0AA40E249_9PEZI|nr:hypothetical protein B0H67DRAFT_574366 [Lasiosphaeris hirsuta]